MSQLNIGINIGLMVSDLGVLLIVLFGVGSVFDLNNDFRKDVSFLLIAIIFANLSELEANVCAYFGGAFAREIITGSVYLTHLCLCAGVLSVSLYIWHSIEGKQKPRWFWQINLGLEGFVLLCLIFNAFTGCFFTVDEMFTYHQNPLYWMIALAIFFPCILNALYMNLSNEFLIHAERRKGILIFLFAPAIAAMFSIRQEELELFYPAATLSVLIMIFYLIAVENQKKLIREEEITELNTKLFLARLRPHFLYNALSSISSLCTKEPEDASELLDHFSEYMRTNMEDLFIKKLVSFKREMQLVEHYLEIEQVRFGDLLFVDFDINEMNFMLPPLVLLPIVENGITHGIGVKEEGGTIFVGTEKQEGKIKITISDDGVGFDTDSVLSGSKVGILQDTIERIRQTEGASIMIKSNPGEGSETVIILPYIPYTDERF